MKKILIVITKGAWGGAQQYVYDIATKAQESEFEVIVAAGTSGELIQRLHEKKIRTYVLSSLTRNIHINKEIHALREIIKVIKEEHPDVIHLNSSKAGFLGSMAARWQKVPRIIFTAHGWAFNEIRPRWQYIGIKIIHWCTVLLSHKTIAVSRVVKEQMDWLYTQHKIEVIYNGRKEKDILPSEDARTWFCLNFPQLKPFQKDHWTVTVAELNPIKQHETTICAIKEVIKTNRNIRHIIIGSGELYEKLSERIQRENLSSHVFLLGFVSNASKYLKAFEFLVLSSKSEGMPYTLIEACIAGIPSIASAVGGIPEIIRDGIEGMLIPSGNIGSLAEVYKKLIDRKDLQIYMGKQAQKRAQLFDLNTMYTQTIRCYGKL